MSASITVRYGHAGVSLGVSWVQDWKATAGPIGGGCERALPAWSVSWRSRGHLFILTKQRVMSRSMRDTNDEQNLLHEVPRRPMLCGQEVPVAGHICAFFRTDEGEVRHAGSFLR